MNLPAFVGVIFGYAIGSLLFGLIILKWGPKDKNQNLFTQAVVVGLLTYYVNTDKYGIHHRYEDNLAHWIGYLITLSGMAYYLFVKKGKSKTTRDLDK